MTKKLPYILIILILCSCAPQTTIQNNKGASIGVKLLEPYNGPKARIAVERFDSKAANIPKYIANGISDMLATALVNSNRFIVLERDALSDIMKEQNLGASGRISTGTATHIGHIEGAELLVMGSITKYEPNQYSFGGVALGIVTGATSVMVNQNNKRAPLGAIMYTDAIIGADIRVIDTRTSRVLFSASINADTKDFGGGVIGVVGGGKTTVPFGFGGFQHTGIKLAIRALVNKATAFICQNTPSVFYHFLSSPPPEPKLIAVHAIPYGSALVKSYPPKTKYTFDNLQVWRQFSKTYFKNPDSILVDKTLFKKEDVVAIFPKTKVANVDLEIQKAVDRISFTEIDIIERKVPPPALKKGQKLPLSYLLASIPKLYRPIYFSRVVYSK